MILTKGPSIQQLALNVLLTLVQSVREQLESRGNSTIEGEGGSEGELLPGTSLVFAGLEVCLCLLVQVFPNINPSNTDTHQMMKRTNLSKRIAVEQTTDEQISVVLDVLLESLSMCSPQGALSYLPTLLHLVTNILKEAKDLGSRSAQKCIDCLRQICCHPYSRLPETEDAYGRLLQSCAARLLDLSKAGEEDRLDALVLLGAISEMLRNCKPELLSCPALLYPSLNAFQHSLQSTEGLLKLHTDRKSVV